MNYFELFGFKEAPVIDKSLVAAKYFELQKQYHPDFFTKGTSEEQEQALKFSADINKAFSIFRDEQRTIEYFLQVKGAIAADEKFALPSDFLMEMMEINEVVSDGNNVQAEQVVGEYEAKLINEITPVLKNYEQNAESPEQLQLLKAYYYKKKYLNRILDRLAD